MSSWKNIAGVGISLALAAQIGVWMVLGRPTLEKRVAETLSLDLRRAIAKAQESGGCAPRHVFLETKTPDADPLDPETLALLSSRCDELGVTFHAEPPVVDLGCSATKCGDCLGYAQQIRYDTPFVAAASTHYFKDSVYQGSRNYFYVFELGRWVDWSAPEYGER